MQSRALALAVLMLALGPSGAVAQDPPPPEAEEDGMALVERGLRSILDGFLTEMKPALDDMGRAMTELRPMAEELFKLIDDIANYEAPVVLENGDILIRRKPEPPAPLKEGEVEL